VTFSWDERKSGANQRKHGLGFRTARLAFEDPNQLSLQDRDGDGEQRWQTLGLIHGVLILVAHTYEEVEEDEHIRIISARKANRREWEAYRQTLWIS